jgi:hypothetical protein
VDSEPKKSIFYIPNFVLQIPNYWLVDRDPYSCTPYPELLNSYASRVAHYKSLHSTIECWNANFGFLL